MNRGWEPNSDIECVTRMWVFISIANSRGRNNFTPHLSSKRKLYIYIYIYIYVQMCQKLRSYERKRHSIRFPLTENGSCIYQRACDREKIRDIWTSQPNIRWSISRYLTSASVGGNLTFYVRLPCMSHMFYHTRRNHFVVSTFILKIKASMLQSDSFLERKIIRCERSCL